MTSFSMSSCQGVAPGETVMFRSSCVFALLLLPLAGCARQTLTVTGASTIAPLAGEIGKAFEAAHPGVRVDVQTGGSSRGVNDTRAGLNSVGMVSRPLKED